MSNEILGILSTFFPFIVIIWVANVAEGYRKTEQPDRAYRAMARISYLSLIGLYSLTFLGGLMAQAMDFVAEQQFDLLGDLWPANFGLNPLLEIDSWSLLGIGLWIPSLVGMLCLLPSFRRRVARIIPIDPQSPVHAIALSYTMLVIMNLMFYIGVGLDNLATLLAESNGNESVAGGGLLALWGQQITMAIFAAIGVGWLTRRSFRATLDRLGVHMPTSSMLLLGIAIGIGMIPVVVSVFALGDVVNFGADPDVEALSEVLLGPLFNSLLGVMTLGFAAALGEETLFRGALQPRFGIPATALIFALVHSNYGITISTVVVFILGIVLGVVRDRYSTTTAMVVHATYNMTLGLMGYLSISFLENM